MKKIIFYNIIIISLLILSLEILFRLFLNISPQGVSPGIINTERSGLVFNYSNIKKGKVFGSKVFTDKNGFRVSKNYTNNEKDENIFFIGGSVTFGNGIDQSKTFTGILNEKFEKINIYNAGVIGSDIKNNYLILKEKVNKDNFKKVFISITLDDLDQIKVQGKKSSQIIRSKSFLEKIKENIIFSHMNNFVRSKSVVYVWIKGIILNAEQGYYNYSLNAFKDKKNLEYLKKYLNLINEYNNKNGKKFIFVILPYSKQTSSLGCTKSDLAEKIIEEYLEERSFVFLKIKKLFCEDQLTNKIFLKHDPAHLSYYGHNLLANYLKNYIE